MRLPRVSASAVAVYQKYAGDPDAFARLASPSEKSVVPEAVRAFIDDIGFRMRLAHLGKASEEFERETGIQIRQAAESEQVVVLLERGA